MRLRSVLALSVVAALTGCPWCGAVEVNLVRNGGFEAGDAPAEWSIRIWEGTGEAAISTETVRSAERSLRLHAADDTAFIVAYQSFPLLDPDAPVVVSGWWKAEVGEKPGARLVMRWLDGSGTKLRDEPVIQPKGSFDWKQFELTYGVPDGAARGELYLEVRENAGDVWYDDVRVVREYEPVRIDQIGAGRDPGTVHVGVFDADAAGGRGYGGPGIHEALTAIRGIEAEIITDLSLPTLLKYDTVVLANVHELGRAGGNPVLARNSELAWAADPRAAISAYVRAGGGLVLTHMSVGQGAFSVPLAPTIAHVLDKTFDVRPVEFADHPLTEGLEPFESSFEDSRVLGAGAAGKVVMRNKSGHALGIVGSVASGRVAAIGLCPGINPEAKPVVPTGGEARLVANAVNWTAATKLDSAILVVTPNLLSLREPEEDIVLRIKRVQTAEVSIMEQPVRLQLLDDGFELHGEPLETTLFGPDAPPAEVTFEAEDLEDGTYYVGLTPHAARGNRTEVTATVKNQAGFGRFADSLPKSHYDWSCMNVHGGVSALDTEEKIAEMARLAKEMNLDAVLYAAKPPSAYLYYDTKIGEKAPGFEGIDPLALAVKHCHAQGLQLLVQFCAFREGSASSPSKFIREHPEYADWNPGDGPDISKHQGGVFGCPDRPEARAYELSLIREMAENYDIDGISFDYIRYKNDRYCVCPYSVKQFEEWHRQHPGLSEAEARAKHGEEAIVSFTWEVRKLLDEVDPDMILHGYCHPTWANRFPLQYLSFRASAHWTQPGRGGPWTLERVHEAAKRNVELADDHVEFMKAAPMADTGYLPNEKPPERFRRELRLINYAGAKDIMIYLYSTLSNRPELRKVIAEELAD